MTDTPQIIMVAAFLLVGGASALIVSSRRHKRDLSEYLEPPLQKCGVTFISAVYPGLFKVGPFPKFEVEVGGPQTSINGTRGEHDEYRIVSFKDSEGQTHQIWALVEFEIFQFKRVRWRAEQKDSLPSSVLPILEN
jgi:hypothetical protein